MTDPRTDTAPTPQALAEFSHGGGTASEVPLDTLLDLPIPVTIELGKTRMTVQDILRLGRGSVIQLERMAGEPVDIIVGDRRFAEGEVVVINEHFGIRITRLLARLPAMPSVA
jgi:flagellar motor switch protein FliN/FliY